jgi:dipeptidyl aminopeptidase/acylaminoacyl peptidase
MPCARSNSALLLACAALLTACDNASGNAADQDVVQSAVLRSCNIPLRFQAASPSERSTFAYDTSASLDVIATPESRAGSATISRIRFRSGRGGDATGLLVVPNGSGPFPAVVLQHGAPGSARDMVRDAGMIAERGAILIAIDAHWNNRPGEVLTFTPQDSAEQVRLIVDIRRAVDYLISRPDVDRSRIAYWGVSYGGAMGALVAGVEPRFKTLILTVADGGLISHFTGPEDVGGMFDRLTCANKGAWIGAMLPVEPIRFIGLARAPLLMQSGRTDALVPPADAERLQRFAPANKRILWYNAGHGLSPEAHADRLNWLREHIGIR